MATTMDALSELTKKDQKYIWHPFTQMQTAAPAIPILRGKGSYLYGEKNNRYLDGISSWWVNLHGHAHPYIIKKIQEQMEELEHVLFAGFTHPSAIALAEKLLAILPGKMNKIFYSDNGSTAVEIAVKMAIQYWSNLHPKTKKTKVICFKNSYHGDTFGAMAIAGKSIFHQPFWNYLFEVETIDPPYAGREEKSFHQLQNILDKEESACFIFEPLVLGAGGMRIYPSAGLDHLLQQCKQADVLTIADEVMTGFGRTGTLFACEQLKIYPDFICLSKGITGGFLPLGATCCSSKIFEAFLGEELRQAFLHGHSYTANPLACSSALASLELLLTEESSVQRQAICLQHQMFCTQWKNHPKLKRCEAIGTLLVIEYKTETSSYFHSFSQYLYHFFLTHEILIRPLGPVLYIMPPYCITKTELEWIYTHIVYTLEKTDD